MKTKATFIMLWVFLLLTIRVFSQAPQGFNYQAVARDSNGSLLASLAIDVKIGIRSGSETGTLVWEEIHTVVTNELGLFTLKVGDTNATPGAGSLGSFSEIVWSSGTYYMEVAIKTDATFIPMGVSELLSVPFALFAEAGNEGPQGAQGLQGIQGPQGDTGPQGTQGDQGPIGPTGDTGPQGAKGDKGDTGDTGATGPQGVQGLKGDKGDPGTGLTNQGNWFSGLVANEGDYVFDRSSGDPLVNSMWIFQGTPPFTSTTQPYLDLSNWIEFEAPEGPEGPQGPIGLDGPKGDTGDTGPQGPVGATGATGAQGPQGDTGPQGAQGDQGPQGDQGIQGIQGVQGIQGDQGLTGPQGLKGDKGDPGDPASDDQDLNIAGNILTIDNGINNIDLSGYLDNTDNQSLIKAGDDLSIAGGVGVVSLSEYLDNTDNQDLVLSGDDLSISGGLGSVDLSVYKDNTDSWMKDGDTISYNGLVGIGTESPGGKLEVMGDGTEAADDPLFEVKRKDGQTVFAVYPEGVRIYVEESTAKGTKGGFAVGGFNPATKGLTNEFLRVTPDSVRVYVNDDGLKGTKGGFAVGGFSPAKGTTNEYLRVSPDSVRVYVNDDGVKGTKGGFAVGGISPFKGITDEYLRVTPDSVRVYINDETAKGTKGGFAVGGYSPVKGLTREFLRVTDDSTRVYVDNDPAKGTKGGFAVGGYSPVKAGATGFMRMTMDNYFIGHESGSATTTGLYNSFLGYQAGLSNTLGSKNILLGYNSGYYNTSGNKNVFLGTFSGFSNSTGYENVFLGDSSGFGNTIGKLNIFLGTASGVSNTSGDYNIFMGSNSGHENTTGYMNTFLGTWSGFRNTTGYDNVFIGNLTGYSNDPGFQNVFVGSNSGTYNFNGDNNLFLGGYSGHQNQYGNSNVYLGFATGYSNQSGSQNIFIGNYAGSNETGSNKLYIDNGATATPLIYGDFSSNNIIINGSFKVTGTIYDDDDDAGSFGQVLSSTGAGTNWVNPTGGSGDGHSLDAADGSPINVVYVTNSGDVGVGTTTPVSKLDVAGAINLNKGILGASALFVNSAQALWYNGTYFSWGYGAQYNYFADRVGIGTSTPVYNLHVEDNLASNDNPAIFGKHAVTDYYGVGVKGEGKYMGVYGVNVTASGSGYGIYGIASGSGTGNRYGVYGTASGGATAYAGYFAGNVHVTGTISKGAGSFKIDHPLDPENKYLSHSFIESPDMKNLYDGTVVLNVAGKAIVELPVWFEVLNMEFRYQLTAIGGPGPNLHISSEVSGNQFEIAGGEPGMKVSWQLTGIRKDPYAEKYRIMVEEDKAPEEKGYYLHPELYHESIEKGLHNANQKTINR